MKPTQTNSPGLGILRIGAPGPGRPPGPFPRTIQSSVAAMAADAPAPQPALRHALHKDGTVRAAPAGAPTDSAKMGRELLATQGLMTQYGGLAGALATENPQPPTSVVTTEDDDGTISASSPAQVRPGYAASVVTQLSSAAARITQDPARTAALDLPDVADTVVAGFVSAFDSGPAEDWEHRMLAASGDHAALRREREALEARQGLVREVANLLEEAGRAPWSRTMERIVPNHFRRYCPRAYHVPAGYHSPRVLAAFAALADLATMALARSPASEARDLGTERSLEAAGVLLDAAAVWRAGDCPVFFLAPRLAETLLQTDLDPTLDFPDLRWPFPAFALMLPKGLLSYAGREAMAVLCSSGPHPHGERADPAWGNRKLDTPAWRSNNWPTPSAPYSFVLCLAGGHTVWWNGASLLDPTMRDPVPGTRTSRTGACYVDKDPALSAAVAAAQGDWQELAVRLLAVLQCCPDLAEVPGTLARAERRRHGKVAEEALWHPNFLGRAYAPRVQAGPDPEAEPGATRRPHWRRGHVKRVRHGPGRVLSDVRWIDRVLVNAHLLTQPPTP